MEKMLAAAGRGELASEIEEYLAELRTRASALARALADDDEQALRASVDVSGTYDSEFLADLLDEDPVFDLSIATPRVLAAVAHLLGPDFHSWGTYCRAPGVGQGHQPLHRDPGRKGEMCGALWMIDNVTAENGATRIVPGTHRSELRPEDELDGDPTRRHPREVVLEGKAGQVVVFSAHTWHGGTARTERGGPRRVVISGYSVRSQFRDQALHVGPRTLERLSPAQRWLLHTDDPKLAPGERAYAASGG
jgi:hypothetical protein